jgi:hypothetical protein
MAKILYAGDSSLAAAAAYLGGVMARAGLDFDYVRGDRRLPAGAAKKGYALFIFSDYPAARLRPADARAILAAVRAGAGLLMIGGWASFHGLDGRWERSPLAEALPVRMLRRDDRVNSWTPVALRKAADHPAVAGLPFDRPTCVGGYNRVAAKAGATTVLVGTHVLLTAARGGRLVAKAGASSPLLVVGEFGLGRTAAFASDAAPHWVGPLVDWGGKRIRAQAPGASTVEVGHLYAAFFTRLIRWTMATSRPLKRGL